MAIIRVYDVRSHGSACDRDDTQPRSPYSQKKEKSKESCCRRSMYPRPSPKTPAQTEMLKSCLWRRKVSGTSGSPEARVLHASSHLACATELPSSPSRWPLARIRKRRRASKFPTPNFIISREPPRTIQNAAYPTSCSRNGQHLRRPTLGNHP